MSEPRPPGSSPASAAGPPPAGPVNAADGPAAAAHGHTAAADSHAAAAESMDLTGPALARAVLDAAAARRPAGNRRRGTGDRTGEADSPARGGRRRRGWSGPGPDPRDPQPFGAALAKLIKDRGWQRPAAEAALFGRWEKVVGGQVAEHCRPVKLAEGELTIEAASTAWATQLRLLARSLLKKIAAEVGHGVVTRLHIHGPAAPSWRTGPRRVRGRGPRDTYG